MNESLEMQIKLISPFCPHISEEMWHKIGKKSFVSLEKWPIADEKKINQQAEESEKAIEKFLDDVKNIIKITGKKPGKIHIYLIPKEIDFYKGASDFLSKELDAKIEIYAVNDKEKYDPSLKASKAKPGRPSIYLE